MYVPLGGLWPRPQTPQRSAACRQHTRQPAPAVRPMVAALYTPTAVHVKDKKLACQMLWSVYPVRVTKSGFACWGRRMKQVVSTRC
jgi:hypothetical protein